MHDILEDRVTGDRSTPGVAHVHEGNAQQVAAEWEPILGVQDRHPSPDKPVAPISAQGFASPDQKLLQVRRVAGDQTGEQPYGNGLIVPDREKPPVVRDVFVEVHASDDAGELGRELLVASAERVVGASAGVVRRRHSHASHFSRLECSAGEERFLLSRQPGDRHVISPEAQVDRCVIRQRPAEGQVSA